ncbi:MAG: glycoside hydrolase family 172 protein [Planctomycetota bacterium]
MEPAHNWLDQVSRLVPNRSRSISSENPTGEPGGGGRHVDPDHRPSRDLGQGWKVRPCTSIEPGTSLTLADIAGPGCIRSIWMTPAGVPYRNAILRVHWDGQDQPSVECPIGDFFASAFTSYDVFAPLNSLAVCVNPGNAFNCYWPMPFRQHCRMTLENRDPEKPLRLYYQINYELGDVPDDAVYFHSQFRRVNPVPEKRVYTILDGVQGQGHYAGTYLAWGVKSRGWWGEGEVKFYIDDDIPEGVATADAVAEHGGDCFPTICGTGTEDYFCGSYNFENKATKQYQEFSTAYAGMPHVVRPNHLYDSQMRFSMYRWHLPDPIRFNQRLAVTIQALGWRSGGRYHPLRDDIASTAYWYQTLPTAAFPPLGDRDALEII